MSERSFGERLEDRPHLSPDQIREVSARELVYRFIAGALTSVAAGALTGWLGPRVAGAFLAFPAILMASLTLIAQEEERADAREDGRGAVIGAAGLTAFAVVAVLTLQTLPWPVALALASAAWAVVSVLGYLVLWYR